MNPNDSSATGSASAEGTQATQPAAANLAPAQPAAAPAAAPRDRGPRPPRDEHRRDNRRPRDDDHRDHRPRDEDRRGSDRYYEEDRRGDYQGDGSSRNQNTNTARASSGGGVKVSGSVMALIIFATVVCVFLWYVGKTHPDPVVNPTVVAPAPTYVAPASAPAPTYVVPAPASAQTIPVFVENPTAVAPSPTLPVTAEALREEMRLQFGTAEKVVGPSSANPKIQWGVGNNGEIRVPIFLRPEGVWSILTGDLVNGVKTPPTITTPEPGRKWTILDNPEVAPKLTAPDGRTVPTDGAVRDGAIVFGTVQ